MGAGTYQHLNGSTYMRDFRSRTIRREPS